MIKLILSVLLLTAIHSQIFKTANMVETVDFIGRISTRFFASADCFQGVLQSETDSSAQQAKSSYYACFYPQSESCGNYAKCYDGWIANYTVSGAGSTEGYPSGVTPYPVFNFKVNSAADFLITRDDSLSSQMKDMIATACRSFDPTVTAPVTSAILASASSSASKRLLIASAPSLLRGDTLYLNNYQKLYIPSYSFSAKAGAANIQVATAPVQSIAVDRVQAQRSSLQRYLEFDTANNLVRQKNEIYSLAVKNGDGVFNLKTTHTLSYKGKQSFDSAALSRLTGQLRTSLTLQDLEKISRNASPSEFDSFTDVDSQNLGDPTKSQQVVLDLQKQLLSLKPTTGASTGANPGTATSSGIFSTKINPVPAPTSDFFTSPFSGFTRNRLLLDEVIFSETRTIFNTYVFGYYNTLEMTVTATLIDKFYLRTTAVIKITRFSNVKYITVYDKTQYVGNSFSFSQNLSGNWNFGVSIPIYGVPFVSSIYLQFSTGYSATASLSGYGVLNLPAFKYTYNYVGNATFSNNFNAIAAVTIWHVIQVGVNGNGVWDKLSSSVPITLEYYYNFLKGMWEIKSTSSWSVIKQGFSFVIRGCWRIWFFGWRPWRYFWPSTVSSGYQAINQFVGLIMVFPL